MIRGFLYATSGAALGLTWEAWRSPLRWLLGATLTWPWVTLVAGPLLLLCTIPVMMIHGALRTSLPPRGFLPVAVLAGLPFGLLTCYLVVAFFGKPGTPWTEPAWLPWMPEALAAGAGLGLGCAKGVPAEEYA